MGDEIVRGAADSKSCTGWVVTIGEMLYRVVDAVDRLNSTEKAIKVGVINKVSINTIDEQTMQLIGNSKFVVVAESWNEKTGLGSRLGTQLLERSLTPKFARMGTTREGCVVLPSKSLTRASTPRASSPRSSRLSLRKWEIAFETSTDNGKRAAMFAENQRPSMRFSASSSVVVDDT